MRMLKAWMPCVSAAIDAAVRWCRYGALALLAAMTAIILLQVFCRYVLNNPLSWPEEAARFMMVWMTFLVIPLAYREGLVVRMETLVDTLPARPRHVLELALHLLIVGTAVTFFREAAWMVERGSLMTASALGIDMRIVFAVLPFSFVLVCIVGLEKIVTITSEIPSSGSGDSDTPDQPPEQPVSN